MPGGKTVVELRVHGVSGTPPEAMLNCPAEFLDRKSGDADAGFYRRAAWIDDTISPPKPDVWRRLMEVYSWGGLTSRRASRALWLLLLPFTLINLAHWMLPPAARRRPAAMVVSVLRLIALSFTVTLLLATAVAVLDLAVWQCAALDYCSSGWGPLALMSGWPTGVRLALGALPVGAMMLALWYLGREESGPVLCEDKPPPAVVMRGSASPLADLAFWNRDAAVQRMRCCHVIVWIAGLAALVLAAPMTYAAAPVTRAGTTVLLAVNLVLVAVAVGATASTTVTGRGGRSDDAKLTWLPKLRWYALALLAVSLVWVALRGDVSYPSSPTFLPGLRAGVYWLLGVQAVLVVALFVGTLWSMRAPRGEDPTPRPPAGYTMTFRGLTAAWVALLGWVLGGGLSVAVGLWTAQILGTVVFSTAEATAMVDGRAAVLAGSGPFDAKVRAAGADAPLILPPPYVWTAFATLLLILITVGVVIVMWLRVFRGRRDRELQRLRTAGPIEGAAPEQLQRRIATSRALASLTDTGPQVIAGLAAATLPLVAGVAAVSRWGTGWLGETVRSSGWLAGISVLATVAIAAGLVALVVQAYRNRQVRRVVGILWDVVTFWPRATHPLTPPSYGGRTVWDLKVRLGQLTYTRVDPRDGAQATSTVVLVAHSQGTIIAAATLLQIPDLGGQCPLLTFGSPLRRLYATNFPAYFSHATMTGLRDGADGPRWINLWAYTDPIGGNVFERDFAYLPDGAGDVTMAAALPGVDCRILDVPQQDPDRGQYQVCVTGPLCGHSGFWLRGEYGKAVDVLQGLVTPEPGSTAEPDSSATAPPQAEAV